MSTHSVPITTIREILPHDNANALEIAKVFDWEVVVQKGRYKPGDVVIYVPVDSVLPWDLEQKIFPPESKIKLRKSRIRSIKIRGKISQGLTLDLDEVGDLLWVSDKNPNELVDTDVAELLGITKYEPPEHEIPNAMKVGKPKKAGNPNFKKYTDIENFKYYDRMFQDYEQVYVSEKLHGTSFRAGWYPMVANTLWKKVKRFFGKLPEWEFCWGSRTIQIQVKGHHGGVNIPSQGVQFDDVYTKMVKQYNLKERIPVGYAVYGEIVGDGIQKGYTYGCGPKEHKLFVYDVMDTKTGLYLDYFNEAVMCQGLTMVSGESQAFTLNAPPAEPQFFPLLVAQMGLERVPELYHGPFEREVIDRLRDGDSLVGGQKIREGIVIKPAVEKTCSIGRKVLKYISDAYYLKNQEDGTDFH